MRLWNFKGEQNNITEALQLKLPDHAVISLTGSGGKTSLMTAWARELAAAGKRTVITTTTHMMHPSRAAETETDPYAGIHVLLADSDSSMCGIIDSALDSEGPVMVVSPDPERPARVMSPPDNIFEHIYKSADAVLIEADGSRRMPLKWPAPWEPAVPEETAITVCVAGLSALGRSTSDVMYRAEHLPERLRRETVDETLISTVLASYEGGQKSVRGEFRVFLNQADDESLRGSAARLQRILGVYGIRSAWGTLLQ